MDFHKKILIIRFSSIGDIVLATSPLKTIRKAYPNATITFLTLDKFSSLLEYHPDIDHLLAINNNMTIKEIWDFRKYIVRSNYDIIYDLHNSLRSNLFTLWSSTPSFQLKKPRIKRAILFYFHKNYFDTSFSTTKMYHEHLGPIWRNTNSPVPLTNLRLSEYEINKAKSYLISKGVLSDFMVLIPGAAWKQKQWIVKNYVKLLGKINNPVIMLGSSSDKICSDIASFCHSVINLSGVTSLRQALGIIANAKHIIGSDTGLLHAAEALGKSVSMILGPTTKETGANVLLPDSHSIEKDIWCRPCSQNGSLPCYRKKQYCMESIEINDVLNSIPLA